MHEYAITLFAPSLTNDHVAGATEVLHRHGLRINHSHWLHRSDTSPAFRLNTTADVPIDGIDRLALLDDAEQIGVDVFLQTPEEARTAPRLFVLDMDSTLIQAEVIDELATLAGVRDLVSSVTERAMRGEIDFQAALRERVALLRGLEVSRLSILHSQIQFSPGAEVLMRGVHAAGCVTVVVSGGFGFFARDAQQRLGFKYLFCNELEIADGTLTGRVEGAIVDAQGKRAALLQVADQEQIGKEQVVAVGDGANDVPMLQEAAIGVAYRAKPVVKAAARYRLSVSPLDCLLHLLA